MVIKALTISSSPSTRICHSLYRSHLNTSTSRVPTPSTRRHDNESQVHLTQTQHIMTTKSSQTVIYAVFVGLALLILVAGAVIYLRRKSPFHWPFAHRKPVGIDIEKCPCETIKTLPNYQPVFHPIPTSTCATNPLPHTTDANPDSQGQRKPRRFGGKKDLKPLQLANVMRGEIEGDVRSARVARRQWDCGRGLDGEEGDLGVKVPGSAC